jgi:hypothetical protein
MKRVFPKRCGTAHQFRARKRRELRAAQEALDVARRGCAYTPTQGRLQQALTLIQEALDLCSVKRWGR